MGDAPVAVNLGDVVLERYRVVEQIASGGHSVVYRGEDQRLSRPVCIKVFSGLAGKSGIARTSYEHFVQEAFALSRLTHPNTLRIFDFGHVGPKDAEGAPPVQVCEFMNGGTLANAVREKGKQTVAETVRVIGAMCAALSEAHGLGIVHRDIKPQNILFAKLGHDRLPKLADFGIAKWSGEEEGKKLRAEDTAIVAGQKLAMYSPSWAAPEQLAGQEVSGATDIYSLATVAVYMLSTQAIFSDEDVYAGYKKRRNAGELVRKALDEKVVGKKVIDVLTRALAFEPGKRTSKIDDLGEELVSLLEGEAGGAGVARSAAIIRKTPDPFASVLTSPDLPSARGRTQSDTHEPVTEPPEVALGRAQTPVVRDRPSSPTPRPPWMQGTGPQGVGARPLALTDQPQPAGERRVHFLQTNVHGHVDLAGPQSTRVRVTLLSAPNKLVIHIKALTSFIAHLGGRPSPAVHLEQPGDVALVTPRAQEIAHIRVAAGVSEGGDAVFALGSERVAVRRDDCVDPILFDFGPGSDAYFVYTRGRAVPRTRTR